MKKLKKTLCALLSTLFAFACGCVTTDNTQLDTQPNTQQTTTVDVTPVIRVTTENKTPVTSKENYLASTLTMTDRTGSTVHNQVACGFRGRGNYTWTLDKKGYRIKFDKKQKMMTDYKCKSWALLPNYTDKTLLRNYLALNIAKGMDGLEYTSNATLVELYLNDEYLGMYLLCDQTQVDENRVNVQITNDITTGWLVERDQYVYHDDSMVEGRDFFYVDNDIFPGYKDNPNDENEPYKKRPSPYVIKSPEYPSQEDYATSAEYDDAVLVYNQQFNEIKDFITNAYDLIEEGNYAELDKICNLNSFADYFILDQVLLNYEIDRYSSFFMYKDVGGKMQLGPVWDFDCCAGYVSPNYNFNGYTPDEDGLYQANTYFKGLYKNAQFRELYATRLHDYRQLFITRTENLRTVALKNKDAIDRNNEKWPVSTHVHPMNDTLDSLKTYNEQLDFLIDFVKNRYGYIDEKLAKYRT